LKVSLINPFNNGSYPQPPMGLALLAAVLETRRHQVNVIDANALGLRPEGVSASVDGADVVGITAMTPMIAEALRIASQLKKSHPELPVILGGAHASLMPEETLKSAPQIDILVKGEGENTFVDLLDALQSRKSLEGMTGVNYRKDGVIVSNSPCPSLVDLDLQPFLAYHLLPLDKYKPHPPHGRSLPFAALITSRGCPYNCSYCSKPVFGYKFRAQSSGRVIEEIIYYKKRFGVREIAFYDDVFTLNKKRVHDIAEGMISKDLKLHWTCETRVDLVNKEMLRHMKAAGCYAVSYGIESASQEILDVINKKITREQMEEAVLLTREAGIQAIGYFMIGSPGESVETIKQTIKLAKDLRFDYAQFAIATPFPGTEFYRLYAEKNKVPISWERFVYDGVMADQTPLFESPLLSRRDLQYWRKRAYKEFYLRPSYIWEQIRKLTSLGDLKLSLRGLRFLFSYLKPH